VKEVAKSAGLKLRELLTNTDDGADDEDDGEDGEEDEEMVRASDDPNPT
jgi:hypothetical protein